MTLEEVAIRDGHPGFVHEVLDKLHEFERGQPKPTRMAVEKVILRAKGLSFEGYCQKHLMIALLDCVKEEQSHHIYTDFQSNGTGEVLAVVRYFLQQKVFEGQTRY